MANCGLKTGYCTLRSAVNRNTAATTTTMIYEIRRTGRFLIAYIEMSDVWNQRSHKKWQDDRNQRRRSEDDCRYKYRAQQGDRNASDRNGPSNQPRHYDHGRHHQRDG